MESLPEIGRIVTEIGLPAVREMLKNGYRIVYRIISADRLDILRIYHSSQPLPTLT
ncbi:type II toxin-antitoxin system RelE/ParE family toxin [Hymenobacter arcticus]